ncbi:autotransporter-associated beta strand repeat-containing protein, partial [Snodgrassella sp. CFCC 13594]|uniref:autotransporter-associated beta strand repeat-containing protein n=1 Tax=Snodgrassella sp. CFCC 13594 TaxID=1775559 RepID=UPI000A72F268
KTATPYTGSVAVGNNADAVGAINVTNTGSTLSVADTLYVNASGTGTVTVGDGGTIVVGNQLSFGDGSALSGKSGTFNLNKGGTLAVGGNDGIVANVGQGSYTMNLAGGTLAVTNADLTTSVDMTTAEDTTSTINTGSLNALLSGSITGAGNLNKTGTGTLTLTGDNSYGDTKITEGIIN